MEKSYKFTKPQLLLLYQGLNTISKQLERQMRDPKQVPEVIPVIRQRKEMVDALATRVMLDANTFDAPEVQKK